MREKQHSSQFFIFTRSRFSSCFSFRFSYPEKKTWNLRLSHLVARTSRHCRSLHLAIIVIVLRHLTKPRYHEARKVSPQGPKGCLCVWNTRSLCCRRRPPLAWDTCSAAVAVLLLPLLGCRTFGRFQRPTPVNLSWALPVTTRSSIVTKVSTCLAMNQHTPQLALIVLVVFFLGSVGNWVSVKAGSLLKNNLTTHSPTFQIIVTHQVLKNVRP